MKQDSTFMHVTFYKRSNSSAFRFDGCLNTDNALLHLQRMIFRGNAVLGIISANSLKSLSLICHSILSSPTRKYRSSQLAPPACKNTKAKANRFHARKQLNGKLKIQLLSSQFEVGAPGIVHCGSCKFLFPRTNK